MYVHRGLFSHFLQKHKHKTQYNTYSIMKIKALIAIVYTLITIVLLVGEIKCIVKMVNCNWEPIGKSEIIYTLGTFTGFGCIIGYIDIEDK